MHKNEDLEEKKVLGSGGYAFVNLTEDEELKFNLGVPHLFLGNIGRLDKTRFTRYYCKRVQRFSLTWIWKSKWRDYKRCYSTRKRRIQMYDM